MLLLSSSAGNTAGSLCVTSNNCGDHMTCVETEETSTCSCSQDFARKADGTCGRFHLLLLRGLRLCRTWLPAVLRLKQCCGYVPSVLCQSLLWLCSICIVSVTAVAVFHLYCVSHCCGCVPSVLSQSLLWLCSICTVSITAVAVFHLYCLNHCCGCVPSVLSQPLL